MNKLTKCTAWLLIWICADLALVGSSVVASDGAEFAEFSFRITAEKKVGSFDLGVGTSGLLQMTTGEQIDGIFLGDLVDPSGLSHQLMFLDVQKTKVILVPKEQTNLTVWTNAQTILDPYEQVNSTCGAYAMYHYFLQLDQAQALQSSAVLKNELSTEIGRTKLLVQFLDRYYIQNPTGVSMISVLKHMGKTRDIRCAFKQFKKHTDAIQFLHDQLDNGKPVLIGFDIAPDMLKSTYEVTEFDRRGTKDPRLWIPRKRGQRSGGGHSIVLAASFEAKKRYKAVVLDSDWDEPRIWDVEKYINSKTAMKTFEFYTCH